VRGRKKREREREREKGMDDRQISGMRDG